MDNLAMVLILLSLLGGAASLVMLVISLAKKDFKFKPKQILIVWGGCIVVFAISFIIFGITYKPTNSANEVKNETTASVQKEDDSKKSEEKIEDKTEDEKETANDSQLSTQKTEQTQEGKNTGVTNISGNSESNSNGQNNPNKNSSTSSSNGTTTNEPAQGNRTVYWTSGGKSYHYNPNCSTLKKSKNVLNGPASSCPKTDPCDICAK